MHDVIIDDTKTSLAASANLKQRDRKQKAPIKKRSFSVYLVDWVEKSLIIACLLSIDFLAFAGAGSYQMFNADTFLTLEIWYILGGILAISLLLMYIFSFSPFFQNVVVATVVGSFVTVMLNQFAAFDKNSMLVSLVATYVSQDVGLLFNYVSHIILSIVIGFIFFLFVSFASKKLIAWFIFILFGILFVVVFTQMQTQGENQKYRVVKEDIKTVDNVPGKRFIFIGLPTVGSYNYFHDMIQEQKVGKAETENLRKLLDIMLGFYAKNDFMIYPHAYVTDLDVNNNWGQTLNVDTSKKPSEYMQKNISVDKFWKFNYLSPKDIFLKENKLYDTFKKAKFGINAYQSGGIEMCKVNNEMVVNRCIEKNSRPIDFDGIDLSLEDKIKVLAAQWIESMELFEDFSYPYGILKPFINVDSFPVLGVSYKNIDVKNSLDVLDRLINDINQDTGNKAYFVRLNLPGDTYIYDEFCRVKPIEKWQTKVDYSWSQKLSAKDKRNAYSEQLRCVFGALEKFMSTLQQSEVGKKSVIVIQGMSGLNGMTPLNEKGFLKELKNQKYVDMAIKDPLKGGFKISQDICSAPNILKQYLYRKGKCPELKEFNLHVDAARDFSNSLHSLVIDDKMIETAKKSFETWYQEWQKKQSGGALKANVLLPIEKQETPEINKVEENSEVIVEEKIESTTEDNTAMEQKNVSEENVTDVLPEKGVGKVQMMIEPVQEQAEAAVEKLPIENEGDDVLEQENSKQPEAANDNIPLENTAEAE